MSVKVQGGRERGECFTFKNPRLGREGEAGVRRVQLYSSWFLSHGLFFFRRTVPETDVFNSGEGETVPMPLYSCTLMSKTNGFFLFQ